MDNANSSTENLTNAGRQRPNLWKTKNSPDVEQFPRKMSSSETTLHTVSSHQNEYTAKYFTGPRDLDSHSKVPMFLRIHGSIMPHLIVPLTFVGLWSSLITYISNHYISLAVEPILITVLGIVVSLSLSFRSSSAYERYSEGRRLWSSLAVHSRTLARLIWIHIPERENTEDEPDCETTDLLSKVSAINLIHAYAVAIKHRLRFQPFTNYDDMSSIVGHLDTYAKEATRDQHVYKDASIFKKIGRFLSLSFTASNPRKQIKRAEAPLGNLPMEVLLHISAFIQQAATDKPGPSLVSSVVYTQMMNTMVLLQDIPGQADRVLATPLPVGYNILISQLVILYTYLLPFQLYNRFGWVTVPAVLAASYIIMGLAAIGNELENPFGNDVNDLPLDAFCEEIRHDLDYIISRKRIIFKDCVEKENNKPLWPLSSSSQATWHQRDIEDIRSALRSKVYLSNPLV
ncbi:unnamed protein product [Blumeria hordei]|uniref:Uncharacterized protein n=2 Tax=Blumeria hordei TaxID=2867405 RepID=A0A383UPP7_BLUHO|nr:UPF0187 domain membrane protein [Blumeria hordei DH14]SZF02314.1 unnamed protein product [Blumeria hordei]